MKEPEINITVLGPMAKMAVNRKQACSLLSVSSQTLWRLKSTGKIKPTSYGTYAVAELERHLREEVENA